MPWKFLLFLLFLAVVILFAGINVNNSADVNLGFHRFEDVPVFVGLGSAFMLGALSILPFALSKSFMKRRKLSTKYKEQQKAERQKAAEIQETAANKKSRKERKAMAAAGEPAHSGVNTPESGGQAATGAGDVNTGRKLFGKKRRGS